MKKIFCFLIFTVLLISCSEGDIIENDISNFDAQLENCANEDQNTFVFFKVNNSTNSSISINFTSSTFDITPETNDISITEPTIITLNSDSNQLIYREFNSTISGTDYFCSSIPPNNPTVSQELISTNGTLEISYTELEPTANTQKRYTRTLTILNSTLEGDGVTIRNELLVLGSDTIDADISIDFTGEIKNCPETTANTFTLYKLNTDRNKAITLDFVDETFDIIPLLENISEDTPLVITLNSTDNKIAYKEYSSAIPEANVIEAFCNNTIPGSITTTRELIGTSGTIEVSYEKLTPVDNKERFNRSYTLKNVILEGTGTPIQIDSFLLETEEITLE